MQLLLIEDDQGSRGWLADRLAGSGFIARQADSPEQALRNGMVAHAAAVIIDVGLSGAGGAEYVRLLRDAGMEQPLMILSARGNWRDKVESLDAGADDYLIKPVRAEEVGARLRAIIRRSAGSSRDRIVAGEINLDLKARCAWRAGECLDLTRSEFRLLRLFLLWPDRLLAHQEIQDLLYSDPHGSSHNAIEVHIARLRRKIGRERIRTIRGVGYRFVADIAGKEPPLVCDPQHGSSSDRIEFDAWSPEI